jgi:hypothetical protein
MAIELLSSDNNTSPRISFSHDFSQCEIVPVDQQRLIRSSSTGVDFDFCVRESFESSSADELFSDGKILATEIKKKKKPALPSPDIISVDFSRNNPKNKTKLIRDETEEDEIKQSTNSVSSNTKSFWGFKRSSSLNCGNSYGRSFCPLPLLSRSNSTGSTPNEIKKQKHVPGLKSTSSSTSYQKPPLKRNYGSGGHVRINPVLNVPSANLFGLASLFSNGSKDKNKKK